MALSRNTRVCQEGAGLQLASGPRTLLRCCASPGTGFLETAASTPGCVDRPRLRAGKRRRPAAWSFYDLDRRIVDPVAQPAASTSPTASPMAPPATTEYTIELGHADGREAPGGGGGHRRGVEHQRRGVVEQRFSFQDRDQPPWEVEPPGDAGRRRFVGRADRGAEHERHRPGQVTDPVGGRRHPAGGRHDQRHGQHPDRAGVAAEPGRGRRDRRVEHEQREQAE